MKILITYMCILLTGALLPLRAANDTFMDYQNYNHGYCPDCNCYPCKCKPYSNVPSCATCEEDDEDDEDEEDCGCDEDEDDECDECDKPNPCDPAPVCGTNCGISVCWIGLGLGGIAAAAAIIVGSNNGSRPSH